MSALDEIKGDIEGVSLLLDWLGNSDGQAVPAQLAEWRASVCTAGNLGQPCRFNTAPNWWHTIKSAIAETIRKELALKHQLSYRTSRDSSLHMCKVCGCCLPLKVHVPIRHIKEHTPDSLEFPAYCWIKREIGNP